MKPITMEQFLVRQPSFPEQQSTDIYYLKLANHLLDKTVGSHVLDGCPDGVVQRAVLTAVGYYQDVICDGGIWHAFINECRRLYGRTLPFFDTDDTYIDYELNEVDLRFIAWYGIAMNYEGWRLMSPFDDRVGKVAALWYAELDRLYDDAPEPEGHRLHHELEINNPEDAQALYKLGNWLFMHCYLMTPAYALTLGSILAENPELTKTENFPKLHQRLEQSMMEDPTGPLALYLREWLYLVVEDRMPAVVKQPAGAEDGSLHPYYAKFTAATGGEEIAWFGDYESLNRFFIEVLGWDKGEEHLPQLKGAHDFVLMVNRTKGMLVARDIARCVAAPSNPYYDSAYAARHAICLLTVRGMCPADLLHRICEEGWLPDAVFPGDTADDAHRLVSDNYDFIARCYLQQYYRGD